MRKIISLSIGVALAATVFAALPAAAESATVTRGGGCGLPGLDGDGNLIGQDRLGTIKKLVVNDNSAMLVCKGTEIQNDYERTRVDSGFPCAVFLPDGSVGMTEDSFVKIGKDGDVIMKCTLALDGPEDDSEVSEDEEA